MFEGVYGGRHRQVTRHVTNVMKETGDSDDTCRHGTGSKAVRQKVQNQSHAGKKKPAESRKEVA